MNPLMQIAILVAFLGTFVEWFAERFLGRWLSGQNMVYASAGVGVVLCILLKVDGLQLLGVGDFIPIVSYVLTGVVVGSGSNIVHKFLNPSAKGPVPPPPPGGPPSP